MNIEEVVIVGGGIAGLATALALQKVGIRSLVLERASKLRYEGGAICLFPNAWRALDALGVSHKLEPLYQPFEKGVINVATGIRQDSLLSFGPGGGARALHRKALIEALAEELPPESIRFSSKLVSIKSKVLNDSSNVTQIELEDGTLIEAKVLIGCDGVHSVVAKWLGLSTPIHSGRGAFRALSVFPQGHGLKHELTLTTKLGTRAGYMTLSDTDVHWFITHNVTEKDKKLGSWDPKEIQREVLEKRTTDLEPELIQMVHKTDPSTLSWVPLLFRYPWDMIIGPTHKGTVTVAGDPQRDSYSCREVGGSGVVSGWFVKWFRDHVFFRFLHPRLVKVIQYDCGSIVT